MAGTSGIARQGKSGGSGPGGGGRAVTNAIVVPDGPSLARIQEHGLNAVIWERKLPPFFLAYARALSRHTLDEEHRIAVGGAPARLQQILDRISPAPSSGRRALGADLAQMVSLYARLSGCSAVFVRLEAVAGDASARFHVDWLGLRLLVSYAGPGTQYLPEWAVDRDALLTNPDGVCRDVNAIAQVPTGAVALFKGSGYAGQTGFGAVHRSPPLSAGTERRLVFVINAA